MRRIVILAAVLAVAACGRQEPEKSAAATADQAGRSFTAESLFSGARLFHEHCAQCHGPEAQGHPDWRNPKVVAAPPLDGTGNAWKRGKQDMIAIIRHGVKRNGEAAMPGWQGRLSDREIEDIIAWYQALWPPETYERWRKANIPESAPSG